MTLVSPAPTAMRGPERGGGRGHPSEIVFGHLDVYAMMSLTLGLLNLNCL